MSKNCKKHKTDSISPCSNNYNEKVKNVTFNASQFEVPMEKMKIEE